MMKLKLYLIGCLLLYFNTIGYSQTSKAYLRIKEKSNFYDGYRINLDSTISYGLLQRFRGSEEYRHFIGFIFVTKDGIRHWEIPKSAIGYGFSNQPNSDTYVSDGDKFYRILKKGNRIDLLMYIDRRASGISLQGIPVYSKRKPFYVLKKKMDKSYKMVSEKKFKEKFSIYFSDCSSVSQQILTGELTINDLKIIIDQYNNCK